MGDNSLGGPFKAIAERILQGDISSMQEAVDLFGTIALQEANTNGVLQERIAELEFSLEDRGWARISGEGENEFSRGGLRKIASTSRIYWLKNPLIKRAVYTQTAYVFGQGVAISARNEKVDESIQAFLKDPKNQTELTSHQARMMKETELQIEGNLFFVFFVNSSTGHTRVRTIPSDEIADVIKNPEDAKEPWYYKRTWQQPKKMGSSEVKQKTAYYPDFRYNPKGKHPGKIDGDPVLDEVVYHVKVNCLSNMTYGVPEVYAALDWSKAYKEFLEDWATIVRALSRFAWRVVSKSGQRGIDVAKDLLNTSLTTDTDETNLPPAAGSVWMSSQDLKMDPIPKSGTTTSVKDGRRLLLMVSAATGIFEHYFGDPSTGNLATTTSMERPMELMFRDRQELWRSIFTDICQFVIDQSALKPSGGLKGIRAEDDEVEYGVKLSGRNKDRAIDVVFPDILEKNMKDIVDSVVSAGTLDGKVMTKEGIDVKTITGLLLDALKVPDADDLLEQLLPEEDYKDMRTQISDEEEDENTSPGPPGTVPGAVTPPVVPQVQAGAPVPTDANGEPQTPRPTVESMMVAAVKDLSRAVDHITED